MRPGTSITPLGRTAHRRIEGMIDGWNGLRILWAWANQPDSTRIDVKKGWAGIQADVDATFLFDSLDKAETFDPGWDRYDGQELCSRKDSTVEGGLGPFGLLTLASQNLEEYTPVFFRVFKAQDEHLVLLCSDDKTHIKDGKESYRPSFAGFVSVDLKYKKLFLRRLIDNSVVESFGAGGKTVISSRVYPTLTAYQWHQDRQNRQFESMEYKQASPDEPLRDGTLVNLVFAFSSLKLFDELVVF
ncbi:hypothetical protein OROGR_023943 [Orobanche gracilis]